jgi:hypothetical protein
MSTESAAARLQEVKDAAKQLVKVIAEYQALVGTTDKNAESQGHRAVDLSLKLLNQTAAVWRIQRADQNALEAVRAEVSAATDAAIDVAKAVAAKDHEAKAKAAVMSAYRQG